MRRYTNIYVGTPSLTDNFQTVEISPQECRLRDMTYSAPISVDVEYTRGPKDKVVRASRDGGKTGSILIGRIPLMLRSDRCVLRGKSEEELARYGALGAGQEVAVLAGFFVSLPVSCVNK